MKRRVFIILGTFLFGFLLWFSVSMSYEYQTTVTTPLVIYGVPEGKAIKGDLPRTVQLRFREGGWRLASILTLKDLTCILDYNTLPGEPKVLTVNDVSERMNLPLGIQPVSMKPESLRVALDAYAWKKVPIVPDYTLKFREGFGQVGHGDVTPESVALGGATSVLQSLTAWKTSHRTFESVRSSIDVDVPLSDSLTHILSLSPRETRLKVEVQQFAEKSFTGLPIEVLSVPSNRELLLNPTRVDIVVRGGVDQLATLEPKNFKATLDYRSILTDVSGAVDVGLSVPPGVQVVTRKPERIQYIIRKRAYSTTGE